MGPASVPRIALYRTGGMALLLCWSLAACSLETRDPPVTKTDGGADSVVDAPRVDLPVPDLKTPDLPAPDLAAPDVPAPDVPLPDLHVPDMIPPDMTPWACTKAADCDDKLACTKDVCTSAHVCENIVLAGHCLVGGACHKTGDVNPKNTCQRCDPSKAAKAWSSNDGKSCDDSKACTHSDTCSGGACKGTAYSCDDKLSCTTDSCTGKPKGCTNTLQAGKCLIKGACVSTGALDPVNTCKRCEPARSSSAYSYFLGSGCVITLAGDGTKGYKDGLVDKAQFIRPTDVAVDSSGKVYVVDGGNHVVRVIWKGQVSTLAGDGKPGMIDGPAGSARFKAPYGIAVDLKGNVYVSDSGNHSIRVVSSGQVTTLAGDGSAGSLNGPAAKARFSAPEFLALDNTGSVFVSDRDNHLIRKIDLKTKVVTTLAGSGKKGFANGSLTTSQFNSPRGIVADSSGRLYVSDLYNKRIRLVEPTIKKVSTIAGSGNSGYLDGAATKAAFDSPFDLAIGPGTSIYIADYGNSAVRLLSTGVVSTVAGGGATTKHGFGDGPVASAMFHFPTGIALNAAGQVLVADRVNNRIRVINPAPGTTPYQVVDPGGLKVSTAANAQDWPVVASDGTGFLAVWADERVGYEIYGAVIGANGSITPINGFNISNQKPRQDRPEVASDGTGYLVVWEDYRNNNVRDIYGARVDKTGKVLDPAGIAISTATDKQDKPSVVFDGANYLVAWTDWRGGAADVYAARVSPTGKVLDPTGFPVSTAKDTQSLPRMAGDGTNTLVVWGDYRNGKSDPDIYGARVSKAGLVLDTTGFRVSLEAGREQWVPMVAFGKTNYLVAWTECCGALNDIKGARVTTSGKVLDKKPIAISAGSGYQEHGRLAFDGKNFLAVWVDQRAGGNDKDIYMARINSAGAVLDPVGIPVASSAKCQMYPSVAFNGSTHLVVWQDYTYPTASTTDVHAARIKP